MGVTSKDAVVAAITMLYDLFVAQGEPIPRAELLAVKDAIAALPSAIFSELRSAIGQMALGGKFRTDERDFGAEIFKIFFADDSSKFSDFILIAEKTGRTFSDFTITAMCQTVELSTAWLEEHGDLKRAERRAIVRARDRLANFLAVAAGPEIRERIFLVEETLRQQTFRKELEIQFLGKKRIRRFNAERKEEARREIPALWTQFKKSSTAMFTGWAKCEPQHHFSDATAALGRLLYSHHILYEPHTEATGGVTDHRKTALLVLAKSLRDETEGSRDHRAKIVRKRAAYYERAGGAE